jgi:hypothetical protein
LGCGTVCSSFLDGVISANGGGSHDIGQYRVAESFFEELDAFWTFKCVPCLSRQFFELGDVDIYVIVFEFEFGDFHSSSIFSGCVQVLDLEFLKKEVPEEWDILISWKGIQHFSHSSSPS